MINNQMPPGQQAPQQENQGGSMPMGGQQGPPGKGGGATNEQDQYDMFVANGISLIHDPKISEGLIKRVAGAADPVDAIARVTLDIVQRLESSAQKNGMELSPTTLAHGANDLMGEVITLAEAAGMQPLNDEQRHQAYSLATALYLDSAVKSGKITPEQLQQMGQEASATPQGQKIAQQVRGGGGGGGERQPMPATQPQQPQVPQQGGLLQGRGVQA